MIPKSEKKRSANLFEKHLQKTQHFQVFLGHPDTRSSRAGAIKSRFPLSFRTRKAVVFDPISGANILSKPIRNPFENHTNKTLINLQKNNNEFRNVSNMGAQDGIFLVRFAASLPYWPED